MIHYAEAPAIIRERAVAIYGSQAHLARLLGISRQALAVRVNSTALSPYLHGWWEGLLLLPVGSLATGERVEAVADAIRAAVALEDARAKWPAVFAMRLRFASPARLEANARRKGPRVKREAGCKKEGAQ